MKISVFDCCKNGARGKKTIFLYVARVLRTKAAFAPVIERLEAGDSAQEKLKRGDRGTTHAQSSE